MFYLDAQAHVHYNLRRVVVRFLSSCVIYVLSVFALDYARAKNQRGKFSCFIFFPGDIVGLYNEGQHPEDSLTGVVTTITNQSITIALDDTFESVDQEASYFIAKLANDVTYKRLKKYDFSTDQECQLP